MAPDASPPGAPRLALTACAVVALAACGAERTPAVTAPTDGGASDAAEDASTARDVPTATDAPARDADAARDAVGGDAAGDASSDAPGDAGLVPLDELGVGTYLGFPGGLYPGGNAMPAAHAAAGAARARRIRRLDAAGNPSASGRYVLLSIGMSNTTQEFCSQGGGSPCDPWTFMGQAAADPGVEREALAIVNGALGGRTAAMWDSPSDPDYDRVRDTRLAPLGLSERQVQVVWVKVANPQPRRSLPDPMADAYQLEVSLGGIVRALRVRYPNVQMVFASSRIYAGFATTDLNPEPYAYESGFAVKWLVQAQIDQMARGAVVDARAGDLDYDRGAPWVAWGPYLWGGAGTWARGDFQADGTHPAMPAERRVGQALLAFFRSSPHTACWFLAGGACP